MGGGARVDACKLTSRTQALGEQSTQWHNAKLNGQYDSSQIFVNDRWRLLRYWRSPTFTRSEISNNRLVGTIPSELAKTRLENMYDRLRYILAR